MAIIHFVFLLSPKIIKTSFNSAVCGESHGWGDWVGFHPDSVLPRYKILDKTRD